MKNAFIALLFIIPVTTLAQKGSKVLPARSSGMLQSAELSIKSRKTGPNYFVAFTYTPTSNKPVRADVSGSTKRAYYVRANTSSRSLFDGLVQRPDTTLFLPGKSGDTVLFYIISLPEKGEVGTFTVSMTDADTTRASLAKQPEKAFNQLIAESQSRFIRLYGAVNYASSTVEFPNGIFYPMDASCRHGRVQQRVAKGLTLEESKKNLQEWTKKISAWLKPYGKITVKQYSKSELPYNEAKQEFLKTDDSGATIFRVEITTSEGESGFYNEVWISG